MVLPLKRDVKWLPGEFVSAAGQRKFSLGVEFSFTHNLHTRPQPLKFSGFYLNKNFKFTHLAPGSTIYFSCTQQIFNEWMVYMELWVTKVTLISKNTDKARDNFLTSKGGVLLSNSFVRWHTFKVFVFFYRNQVTI